MDIFYIIVSTIAIVLLALILTYVGLLMSRQQNVSTVFPPNSGKCPDYWTLATDGSSCMIPVSGSKNVGSIYQGGNLLLDSRKGTYGLNPSFTSINFSDAAWMTGGKSAICSQRKWANQYGIIWDGVSNYNSC